MDPEANRIFGTFELTEQERTMKRLRKLNGHFIPQCNIIHVRVQFHKRDQRRKETVEEYVRVLYELSGDADFFAIGNNALGTG